MSGGGALRAFFVGAQEDTAQAVEDAAGQLGKLGDDTMQKALDSVTTVEDADGASADAINGIRGKLGADGAGDLPGPGPESGGGSNQIARMLSGDDGAAADPAGSAGGGEPGLGGEAGSSGGQASEGNGATSTGGDPVDIVSGQMLMTEVDLELPGVLSLILRRAYASGYRAGRLFGPGWSGTLDQRIQIDDDGIRFAGDDAQILLYPIPGRDGRAVLPAAGARWPLSRDRDTDTIAIEDPGRGWTWHFEPAAGRDGAGMASGTERRDLTRITDRNGNAIDIHRDGDGLPVEAAHSGGYRVAVDCARTAGGPRVTGLRLLDGDGRQRTDVVRFGYDSSGRLTELTDFTGVPYTYEYDDDDRITAWTDRTGYRYQYEYGPSGRVVRGTGDGGFLSASFDYDTENRVTVVTNSLGHAFTHHYDEHGHLTRVVGPDGGTVSVEFDRYGRMLSHADELGRTTRFVLDANGDPVQSIGPDGDVTEISYSDLRMVASVTWGGMTRAEFAYDDRGNLLAETDAAGAVTRYEYDDRGGMIAAVDALGNRTVIERDHGGLIASVTDALGRTSRVTRDGFGRVIAFTDALGAVTRMARRPDGLITGHIAPDGSREEWERDAGGRVTAHVDETGTMTRFESGPFDRMTARTQPGGARFEFSYDTEFRLTAVTSGDRAWTYEYDPAGRLISEEDFNGRRQRYAYDAAGQLLELVGADGRSASFTYNARGDVTERRSPGGMVTTFDYDALGFLHVTANPHCTVEYERDRAGRILAETVNGRTLRYEYDLLGRCTRRVTPEAIVSNWTYDATGHPLALTATGGNLSFSYDDLGRETTRYLGGSVAVTQTWDVRDRLTGQAVWASAVPGQAPVTIADYRNISQRTYSYDATGLASGITDTVTGHRAIAVTPAGRVAEVTGENWTERYTYDSFGNITRAEITSGAGSPQAEDRIYTGTLLRSAGGRFYEYDDRRRLIRMTSRTLSGKRREWLYTWNDDDQLIGVVTPDRGTWAYQYDPLGRRIAKHRLDEAGKVAEQVEFTWDETRVAEQVLVRADGTRHSLTWDWDPGTWRLAAQTERSWSSSGEEQAETDRRFYAIVADIADEPEQFVTADGAVSGVVAADLWGRPLAAGARPSPLGKPGHYHDEETGLAYNYFRYYDPQTGRYLTADPLGLDPSPNQYAYAANPLAWIDPLGLGSQSGKAGGHYGPMKPANPPPAKLNTYEINHIPAKNSWEQLHLANTLAMKDGPAIRMDYNDHRDFISTGSGPDSVRWRAAQAKLISQGKFDEAMKMDIDEIRAIHGAKYDAAIKQMVDDMPNNKGLQEFLNKNGWKIRYCLLQ